MSEAAPPCPVLIVDDDVDLRDALREYLEDEGFETRVAGNGVEALNLLRGDVRPCLVLLDLMMPVMDGWTVLKQLSESPELSSIPVIVMSAKVDPSLGVSVPCFQKPLAVDALIAETRRRCAH